VVDIDLVAAPLTAGILSIIGLILASAGVTRNLRLHKALAELSKLRVEIPKETGVTDLIDHNIRKLLTELSARMLVPFPLTKFLLLTSLPFVWAAVSEWIWRTPYLVASTGELFGVWFPNLAFGIFLLAFAPALRLWVAVGRDRKRQVETLKLIGAFEGLICPYSATDGPNHAPGGATTTRTNPLWTLRRAATNAKRRWHARHRS